MKNLPALMGDIDKDGDVAGAVDVEVEVASDAAHAPAYFFPVIKRTITITKIAWKVPHITLSDGAKIDLFKNLNRNPVISVPFRQWEIYELPALKSTKIDIWPVKTSTQLEKPRWVIVAFQKNKKGSQSESAADFSNVDITNIKLNLNSESYPYESMHLNFNVNKYSLAYQNYVNFQSNYYNKVIKEPLLNYAEFKNCPIFVINCSRQNENLKTSTVDVQLELESLKNFEKGVVVYCLILHDAVIHYNPLTGERKLINARNIIKRKYDMLRENRLAVEKSFADIYKPIIKPLTKISKKIQVIDDDNDDENYIPPKKEKLKRSSTPHSNYSISQNFEGSPIFKKKYGRWNKSTQPLETFEDYSPPFSKKSVQPAEIYETGGTNYDLDLENEEEDRKNATASLIPILDSSSGNSFLEQYHELPRIYVDRMIHSGKNSADIDYTYGIHYDVNNDKWMIGKSYITIDGKDIIIDGEQYKGTPGLYELLIMSNPDYNLVTSEDRNNYRDIIIQTNVARRNYDPNQQLMGTRKNKYVELIKPLLTEKEEEDKLKQKKTGYGVLYKEVNSKPVEYKYWNNVHELIDRLQLLWAEKLAGHGGFDNEILSIVEELYEDGYIEKPSFNFLNI
ncbi:hypothetical protein FQR65_LT14364 [Abscondita terminalis]|nr:hypothetical protein FQR65_LT14364 [Abscondita terminalis]